MLEQGGDQRCVRQEQQWPLSLAPLLRNSNDPEQSALSLPYFGLQDCTCAKQCFMEQS